MSASEFPIANSLFRLEFGYIGKPPDPHRLFQDLWFFESLNLFLLLCEPWYFPFGNSLLRWCQFFFSGWNLVTNVRLLTHIGGMPLSSSYSFWLILWISLASILSRFSGFLECLISCYLYAPWFTCAPASSVFPKPFIRKFVFEMVSGGILFKLEFIYMC